MKRPDTIKRLFVKCRCGGETVMAPPGDPEYKQHGNHSEQGRCSVCRAVIFAKDGKMHSFDNRIRKPRKFSLLAVR